MRTLLLFLVLSATAYAQKAIGYEVVTNFPGSPTERQVVIRSDTLWSFRNGEWRVLRVPYALIASAGPGSGIPYSDTTSLVAMQWELDNKSATGHAHTQANVTGLTDSIAAKAQTVHSHSGLAPTGGSAAQVLTKIDATNYNYSWQTPASGSDPWTVYRRTADTTSSSATPANIGGMTFNVTNGTTYTFYFLLIYQTGATTTGIKTALTAPAGTLAAYAMHYGHAADGVVTPWAGTINSSGDVVTSTAVAVINVNYIAVIEGTFIAGANGMVGLSWGPEVAAAATLKAGSHRMYRTVP